MPQARAAASFEPRAKTRRPNTVRRRTKAMRTARTSVIQTPGAKTIHGTGGKVTASSLIQVGGTLTVVWLASHLAVPRATPSMPRVAMNGTTRRRVMARALTRPTSPPVRTARRTARPGAQPSRTARAQRTPVRAIVEPTARSIPPPTITSVIPMAPMATITVWARTTRRLLAGEVPLGGPARDREEADHEQQADEGPEADEAVPQVAPHAPIAASSAFSGVHSATGRAGERRPRLITARRSQTPRSSGR